jgi:ring-1,2-phenylacetyl-CoA epoxidase subunit PaaE
VTAGAAAVRAGARPRAHAVFHPLVVDEVTQLTDDAWAVGFAVPAELAEDYRYNQGQHLTIRWSPDGRDVRRTYSICTAPAESRLRIGVKRIPDGQFSSYVADGLQRGDVLEVMTPAGRFFTALDPGTARHYAAIVAGSGITPVLSIVAGTLGEEQSSRFSVVYGNRTTGSIMFVEELADLKDRYLGRLDVVHVLSREPQDAALLHGRLDRERIDGILDTLLAPDDVAEWFLCGPLGMVEAARTCLDTRRVDPTHVHSELFHAEPLAGSAADADRPGREQGSSTLTFSLDGRTTVVDMPDRDEAILDAALRVRADAPYACKGGVCGTCRARVLDGQVRMDRNFALERDEREAGFVLTCQSHPLTASVRLDYDG